MFRFFALRRMCHSKNALSVNWRRSVMPSEHCFTTYHETEQQVTFLQLPTIAITTKHKLWNFHRIKENIRRFYLVSSLLLHFWMGTFFNNVEIAGRVICCNISIFKWDNNSNTCFSLQQEEQSAPPSLFASDNGCWDTPFVLEIVLHKMSGLSIGDRNDEETCIVLY